MADRVWRPKIGSGAYPFDIPATAKRKPGRSDIFSNPPTTAEIDGVNASDMNQVIAELNRRLALKSMTPAFDYISSGQTTSLSWLVGTTASLMNRINALRVAEGSPQYAFTTPEVWSRDHLWHQLRSALHVPTEETYYVTAYNSHVRIDSPYGTKISGTYSTAVRCGKYCYWDGAQYVMERVRMLWNFNITPEAAASASSAKFYTYYDGQVNTLEDPMPVEFWMSATDDHSPWSPPTHPVSGDPNFGCENNAYIKVAEATFTTPVGMKEVLFTEAGIGALRAYTGDYASFIVGTKLELAGSGQGASAANNTKKAWAYPARNAGGVHTRLIITW